MNKEECELCIKYKTMYCPNSNDCYMTQNKPYYQNRIMLLEENQQLKERYENLMCGYKFLNNRLKQGMNNVNKNICLIELGNQILRELEKSDSNE